jgi:NAD(P)H-flavin reductase
LNAIGFGFHPAQASIKYFDDEDGGVIRLEYSHNHDSWSIGQHFFLCFPVLSIWQSHPFTVASVPTQHPANPKHVYIIRCRTGETKRLKELALQLAAETGIGSLDNNITTSVVMMGPYGNPLLPSRVNSGPESTNILTIAGGTGISLTLPLALAATSSAPTPQGVAIDFVWAIRRSGNMQWIAAEMEELRTRAKAQNVNLNIHIYISQEEKQNLLSDPLTAVDFNLSEKIGHNENTSQPSNSGSSITSSMDKADSNFEITYLGSQHPSLHDIINGFLESRAHTGYRTRVIASGPAGMGHDLRAAVAVVNNGTRVWNGERNFDVELEWDNRVG